MNSTSGRGLLLAESIASVDGDRLCLGPQLGVALHRLQPDLLRARQVPLQGAVGREQVRLAGVHPGPEPSDNQGGGGHQAPTRIPGQRGPEGEARDAAGTRTPSSTAPVTRHSQNRRLYTTRRPTGSMPPKSEYTEALVCTHRRR